MRTRTTIALVAALAGGLTTAPAALAKHGADDPAGHIRKGHGADDTTSFGKQRQRHGVGERGLSRGADDPAGHIRKGRGADDKKPLKRGADDPAGHIRQGRGADDGAGHR